VTGSACARGGGPTAASAADDVSRLRYAHAGVEDAVLAGIMPPFRRFHVIKIFQDA